MFAYSCWFAWSLAIPVYTISNIKLNESVVCLQFLFSASDAFFTHDSLYLVDEYWAHSIFPLVVVVIFGWLWWSLLVSLAQSLWQPSPAHSGVPSPAQQKKMSIGWSVWMVSWLVGSCLVCWMVAWLVSMVAWCVGWLLACLLAWLFSCLVANRVSLSQQPSPAEHMLNWALTARLNACVGLVSAFSCWALSMQHFSFGCGGHFWLVVVGCGDHFWLAQPRPSGSPVQSSQNPIEHWHRA